LLCVGDTVIDRLRAERMDGLIAGGAAFSTPLSRPAPGVLLGTFAGGDLPPTRRTVAQYARSCGPDREQAEVHEPTASEPATNSVRHGGSAGTVAMWRDAVR
jgi:hypothetical protein